MNVERLNRLVEILEQVPDEQFNLRDWKVTNCKTVCCAFGWYVELAKPEGITWTIVHSYPGSLTRYSPVDHHGMGYDVVEKHFGLSKHDSRYLFSDSSYDYPNKENVIRRIRKFINENSN